MASAIRGSRVGAGPMGEAERGDSIARAYVSYFCAKYFDSLQVVCHDVCYGENKANYKKLFLNAIQIYLKPIFTWPVLDYKNDCYFFGIIYIFCGCMYA